MYAGKTYEHNTDLAGQSQAIGTSPRTGISLKRTNKCLCEAVKFIRNRRRTFRFNTKWKLPELDIDDDSTIKPINHLTIEAPREDSEVSSSEITDVTPLISKIKNLKTLTWNAGSVPIEVLNALAEHHPSCALRTFQWWRPYDSVDGLSDPETALTKFGNLTHFRNIMNKRNGFVMSGAYSWLVFLRIVASCARLELASWQGRMALFEETLVEEQISEKIENNGPKNTSLKTLSIDCPRFCLSLSRLNQIGAFLELSSLECLRFTRGLPELDYFQNAAALLPNLKHISLNFTGVWKPTLLDAAGEYLRNCPPVKTLSLWGWNEVITVLEIVSRHGTTLESLQLHEREEDEYEQRNHLNISQIKAIRTSCLRLTDLTFDIHSPDGKYSIESENDTQDILDVLEQGQPRLQRLQLYVNCHELVERLRVGIFDDDSSPISPPLDTWDTFERELKCIEYRRPGIESVVEPYATAIWRRLYGKRTTGDRILDVKFGNWESRPLTWSVLEEPRTYVEVRPHERDDRVGDYTVKTRLWSAFRPGGV